MYQEVITVLCNLGESRLRLLLHGQQLSLLTHGFSLLDPDTVIGLARLSS
jgi:hypothetical protein